MKRSEAPNALRIRRPHTRTRTVFNGWLAQNPLLAATARMWRLTSCDVVTLLERIREEVVDAAYARAGLEFGMRGEPDFKWRYVQLR